VAASARRFPSPVSGSVEASVRECSSIAWWARKVSTSRPSTESRAPAASPTAGSVTAVVVPRTRMARLTMAKAIGTLISERSRTATARPRRGIQAAAAKQTEIVHQPGS
jgi:hypothetical protein